MELYKNHIKIVQFFFIGKDREAFLGNLDAAQTKGLYYILYIYHWTVKTLNSYILN